MLDAATRAIAAAREQQRPVKYQSAACSKQTLEDAEADLVRLSVRGQGVRIVSLVVGHDCDIQRRRKKLTGPAGSRQLLYHCEKAADESLVHSPREAEGRGLRRSEEELVTQSRLDVLVAWTRQ